MMGANHIRVRCYDGVTRMGRIKGKIKKRVWIREGDILIVTPWSFQDEKCDIIYRYLPPQADWLRKNRYLYKKNLLLSCSAGNARFFVPGFSCSWMQEQHANPWADFSKK